MASLGRDGRRKLPGWTRRPLLRVAYEKRIHLVPSESDDFALVEPLLGLRSFATSSTFVQP